MSNFLIRRIYEVSEDERQIEWTQPGPYGSTRKISFKENGRLVFIKGTTVLRLNNTIESLISSFPLLEVLIAGQTFFIPGNLIKWE